MFSTDDDIINVGSTTETEDNITLVSYADSANWWAHEMAICGCICISLLAKLYRHSDLYSVPALLGNADTLRISFEWL